MKDGYEALVELFREWRTFERPPLRDGAPDYTAATFERRHAELAALRARLRGIDPASWPIARQVDYRLVLAEMNGLDFYIRVLKPWTRDPAFYKSLYTEQSDTPAHEGPTHHAAIELWTYSFPLDAASESRLAAELHGIPPLLAQARGNLTGNARDLWVTGAGTMRQQTKDLEELDRRVPKAGTELKRAIRAGDRGNERVRRLAGQPSAVEERAVRHRQGELHLVAAQRASRADDMGGGGQPARARARARACVAAPGGASQPRAAAASRRRRCGRLPASGRGWRHALHRIPEEPRHPAHARLYGPGAARAPWEIPTRSRRASSSTWRRTGSR